MHSVNVDGNYIYIIGGSNSQFKSLKSCELYDTLNQSSTHLGNLIDARRDAGSIKVPGKLYVFGGLKSEFTEVHNL